MTKKNKKDKVEKKAAEVVEDKAEVAEEPKVDIAALLAEMTEKYQRLGADYQNYQKRAERQITQSGQFAKEAIVKALLPVLDNMDHTLEKGHTSNNIAELMQAVQIVFDHFKKTLEGQGLKPIKVEEGMDFDPACHEALMHEESADIKPNGIVRELTPGYAMNDRTLRPARVSVAKAPVVEVEPEAAPEENQDSGE